MHGAFPGVLTAKPHLIPHDADLLRFTYARAVRVYPGAFTATVFIEIYRSIHAHPDGMCGVLAIRADHRRGNSVSSSRNGLRGLRGSSQGALETDHYSISETYRLNRTGPVDRRRALGCGPGRRLKGIGVRCRCSRPHRKRTAMISARTVRLMGPWIENL